MSIPPLVAAGLGQTGLTVGFIWLAMTIAFEFLFGHFVAGHPWSKLLQAYDIFEGHLWPPILI